MARVSQFSYFLMEETKSKIIEPINKKFYDTQQVVKPVSNGSVSQDDFSSCSTLGHKIANSDVTESSDQTSKKFKPSLRMITLEEFVCEV